jgi:pyroglutamyl-peptidase
MARSHWLVTTFATWRADQPSNAADDLVAGAIARGDLPKPWIVLRHLPVDFVVAPAQVRAAIAQHHPNGVLCCGMAEGRSCLSLERLGWERDGGDRAWSTSLDLEQLSAGLSHTDISTDAGTFVCNALYTDLLRGTQQGELPPVPVLFVHVPVLTEDCIEGEAIAADFAQLIRRLAIYPGLAI